MNRLFRRFAGAVSTLALCGGLLVGLLGAVYELFGPVRFEEMASALGIADGYRCMWILGAIVLGLCIIACLIKE